ncbi:MAG: hypothetical protein CVU89_15350 [Firmicutes bacterium HGW-Firmicutes-14]|nr:MAG: hypothetical protein CVU89_15350 [Firmicutes bacterium HGW-Firmicutes-14]
MLWWAKSPSDTAPAILARRVTGRWTILAPLRNIPTLSIAASCQQALIGLFVFEKVIIICKGCIILNI